MKQLTSIISLLALILVYGSGLALWTLITLEVSTAIMYFMFGGMISDYLNFLPNILSILFIIKIIWGIFLYIKMNISGELYFYGDFIWEYKEFNYGNLQKKKRIVSIIIISFLHSMTISIYVTSLFYYIFGISSLYIYLVVVMANILLCISIFWLDQNMFEDEFNIMLNSTESLLSTFHFIYS